jgi:hypothetical protein
VFSAILAVLWFLKSFDKFRFDHVQPLSFCADLLFCQWRLPIAHPLVVLLGDDVFESRFTDVPLNQQLLSQLTKRCVVLRREAGLGDALWCDAKPKSKCGYSLAKDR